MDYFTEQLISEVKSCRYFGGLYKAPLGVFEKMEKKSIDNLQIKSKIRILILTSTCNGFGDIIASMKVKKFLEKWYKPFVEVKTATNNINGFITLGEKVENLVYLKTRSSDSECQQFNTMKPFNAFLFNSKNELVPEDIENFDLYFVVPLTADFYQDFKEMIYKSIRSGVYISTT